MTLNAEQKEQVKAVIARISDKPPKLSEQERETFEGAASSIYNSIGPDSGWVDRSPSKAVFFDVICDQMGGRMLTSRRSSSHEGRRTPQAGQSQPH